MSIINHPNRTTDEILKVLDNEIKKLQDKRVSVNEIKRAVKQAQAVFAYGSENITNQAFWMGYSSMVASYDWFTNYLKNISKVTPADVQRVAQKYFQPSNRVVGIYEPNGMGG